MNRKGAGGGRANPWGRGVRGINSFEGHMPVTINHSGKFDGKQEEW